MKLSMSIVSLALLATNGVTADGQHGTRLGSQRRTDLSRHSDAEKAEMADQRGGCFDVYGWHDSYGEEYNCDWYGDFDGACSNFGADNEFANFGHTANIACCACGGGSTDLSRHSAAETDLSRHSAAEKDLSRHSAAEKAEIAHQSKATSCSDVIGWHDSYGPTYDCDWYEEFDWYGLCSTEGHLYENEGHTANTACCTCGGGGVTDTVSVSELCWLNGTLCEPGETCDNCCHDFEQWDSKFYTACGQEPCWEDGTGCGFDTTCHNCCTGNGESDCPWRFIGVCTC